MPCEQCEEGLYKWGETGECLYETLEDCQLANQGEYLEEEIKPQADEPADVDVDWTYNFTKEQMEVLHEEGELLVTVEKQEEESMTLLFTYDNEEVEEELEEEKEEDELEREYAKLTMSMLDDELDEYIDKITESIKKL